ncbi:MAG: agmatine deiminase family protein [Opitutaceae bacterium]
MSNYSTPKELGYRFPAEWEPQDAVWFAWPTRTDLWGDRNEAVKSQLAALYVLAARFQTVRVLCPVSAQSQLKELMDTAGDAANVELYDYETDDVWCRDFGPLFLLNEDGSELYITDWQYNAWGNKFPLLEKDNAASAWIAKALKIPRISMDAVLEGGAIESNGAGQLMTTEAVLLNPNRNGSVNQNQMLELLQDGLGIDELLWLDDGLAGDDTDGHIDNLARFFKKDGILFLETPSPDDVNYDVLCENTQRTQNFRTPRRQAYASVALPLPKPILVDGEPLAASYMNFLILNGAVIVPTYGQASRDEEAIEIISSCFPDREVIGFDCQDIIHEGGAIHCMSQHQPALKV